MKPAIEVKNLSKEYTIFHEKASYYSLRDELSSLFSLKKNRAEKFLALKDVSFQVQPGEILGIIGPNGAGKSTLLKILSRITPPSSGEVILRGSVGSLLEVGTGFHPELSGRENIFLNGAILGMSRKEIAHKFDEIVAFSGVEKFLDTPVKFYSSGMYVRLAFAVAAHMDSEILIIDEVLAVGDTEFQKKCLGKMEEITQKSGRTILLVSHNMNIVQNLCQRAVLLDQGQIKSAGKAQEVVGEYVSKNFLLDEKSLGSRKDRQGNGLVKFTKVEFFDSSGGKVLKTGQPFKIKLELELGEGIKEAKNVALSVSLNDGINGHHVLAFWTETTGANFHLKQKKQVVECSVENCPVVSGQYFANLYCTVNGNLSDYVLNAVAIDVDDEEFFKDGIKDHESHPKYVVRNKWQIV